MDRLVGICCVAVVVMLLWSGCRSEEVNPTYTIVPDDSATPTIAATTEAPGDMESRETEETERQSSSSPTVTPIPETSTIPAIFIEAPSIDEQIFMSGVIVRSQLDSVQAAMETVDSGDGQPAGYRAVHELRFRAFEYLKGRGPGAVTVVVRGSHVFDNSGDALAEARYRVATRNTVWDEREAILFLNVSTAEYGSASERSPVRSALDSQEGDVFEFTRSNQAVQGDWDYTIDTLSRAWLPAFEPISREEDSVTTGEQQVFVIETGSPGVRVELGVLRQEIAAWDAAIDAGSGIDGYINCLFAQLLHQRYRRALPLEAIRAYIFQESVSKESGTSAGDVAWSHEDDYGLPEYDRYWLEGEDAQYFSSVRVDDDAVPSNGYSQVVSVTRPLVKGAYVVHEYWQPYVYVPCNFLPEGQYLEWTITVTAPTGTLHEAFFDPVDLSGSRVGATGSSGVIDPDEFTVGSDDVEIDGLEWRNNSVVLTLDDHVSLSGQTLDFIELDGSTDTSLDIADATVNRTAATWTWSVDSQPWEDGDLLMLRIRETDTAAE